MIDVMRSKFINRIALLALLIAMAAGLFSPAACDDFYNKLQGLDNEATEVHAITERSQHEGIIDESSAHHSITCDFQRMARTVSSAGAVLIGRSHAVILPSVTHRLVGLTAVPTQILLRRSSVFFSSYFHLIDGQK